MSTYLRPLRSRRRIAVAVITAATFALGLAACSNGGDGASKGAKIGSAGDSAVAPKKTYEVKVATAGDEFNGSQLAYGLADALGYFTDEGIKIDNILTGSAPDTLKAIAAGQTDIGFVSLSTTLQAIEQGQPVILAAAISAKNGWSPIISTAWLRKKGVDPADFQTWTPEKQGQLLKGTTWVTNSPGGYVERASYLIAKDYLKLDPDQDIKLTAADNTVKIAGIKDGSVQAWLAALPDNKLLVQSGDAVELLSNDQLDQVLPEVGYTTGAEVIVNTNWSESDNEAAAKAFFRAYQKGADYALSHSVDDILAVAKTKYPDADETRLKTTVENAKEYLPADSRHTDQELQYQVDFGVKAGNIKGPIALDKVATWKYLPPTH